MRRTPWKLIAGGLALSLGGLAAVAGLPGRGSVASGAPQQVEQPCPVIPPLPPVGQQAAPQLPSVPAPAPTIVLTPADLPPIPAAPAIIQVQATETAPMPRTAADKVIELSIPTPAPAPPVADYSPPNKSEFMPIPTDRWAPTAQAPPSYFPSTTPPIAATSVDLLLPQATRPLPAPDAAPVPAQFTQPALPEKKLKVMLHMGDDRPRFEVRDGEEVYLKVVCDRVDVKSPSDRGESMSVMKATGKVAFITPGGEGECEELSVAPGTGQVIVNGKVAFKYNWGKVETTVSGDRMTFRLGSAPGMTASPTTLPASYQKGTR